ncbi:MAG: proline dehydrogenase [Deltaproteobacteria bacterium]|nr:proline dehydrogenase [Deltaproteobacteria bacterium]
MRSASTRFGDVRRLLRAASRVVEERASSGIVAAIVDATGLSTEGVELAMTSYLEVQASDAEVSALVEKAGDAPSIAVVLSANVFVGALRAIAFARAAASEVVVRPSRRDPSFARALVAAAEELGDEGLRLDEGLDVAAFGGAEMHVYGRDETIAEVRAKASPRVRVRGHGSGMGVAWISRSADVAAVVRGLADDVVVFDQRGCLSPRIALVEGGVERATEIAEALHAELDRLEGIVPRGAVPAEERAAAGRYLSTMTIACRAFSGAKHGIGVAPPGAPVLLPPPYRHVHVGACASIDDAAKLVAPLAKGITALGSDDLGAAKALAPPWSRLSALGVMQRPPFDGPVDLREVSHGASV